MTVALRNLKGTKDYLAQEQVSRQVIIGTLQTIFEKYGYQSLETPTICYLDILESKYAGGSEILKEVYKLDDQGGRELGLRYDLTIPLARFTGMNQDLKRPFKRYEIGKVFRDGPVKLGRNREFIQCDVDIVGVKSLMADAELMIMATEVYRDLGLDIYVSYNNRKLLSGIIEYIGIRPKLISGTILSIDKIEKIGRIGVKGELLDLGISMSKIDKLLTFMEMSFNDLLREFTPSQPNIRIKQGIKELEELKAYIDDLENESIFRFSPGLARGLEIYTGTVWEVFLCDGSITSSVGAGGRYDNIIGEFIGDGIEYPAVGMTFGLDVIYEALKLKGALEGGTPTDIYIIPLGTEQESLNLATRLRKNGIKVDIDMTGRRLKKSLDYANKQCLPYVIILGKDELDSGEIKLKEMNTGTEYKVYLDNITDSLKDILNRE